jgi:hypothetical protein
MKPSIALLVRSTGKWIPSTVIALSIALSFSLPAHAACAALSSRSQAKLIAGHAFPNHHGEFAQDALVNGLAYTGEFISNVSDLTSFVDRIMQAPSTEKKTQRGYAYWDDATGTVVIYDETARNCGTVFRPGNGMTYYNGLK